MIQAAGPSAQMFPDWSSNDIIPFKWKGSGLNVVSSPRAVTPPLGLCSSAGDERCDPAAGLRGGVCDPVPDVRRLPPRGGQRLLEGRGASQAEGRRENNRASLQQA